MRHTFSQHTNTNCIRAAPLLSECYYDSCKKHGKSSLLPSQCHSILLQVPKTGPLSTTHCLSIVSQVSKKVSKKLHFRARFPNKEHTIWIHARTARSCPAPRRPGAGIQGIPPHVPLSQYIVNLAERKLPQTTTPPTCSACGMFEREGKREKQRTTKKNRVESERELRERGE